MQTGSGQLLPLWWVIGVGAAIVVLALLAWLYRRRRAARSVAGRLRSAGEDLLSGFLLPNADTGEIHVEHAVLTCTGIVVVDVRDVAGHVFGSESMPEWTVLGGSRRFTFGNPLPALYDRVAAVRRVVPEEAPVRGVVAFTSSAEFAKGIPADVRMLTTLLEEIEAARHAAPSAALDGPLREAWQRLRAEAARRSA